MSTQSKSSNFELRKFGSVLVTRDQGEPIRRELLALLDTTDRVTVLLDGVDAYTPSFMDEVLGKCLEQLGKKAFRERIELNAGLPEVKRLVNLVLSNRANKN